MNENLSLAVYIKGVVDKVSLKNAEKQFQNKLGNVKTTITDKTSKIKEGIGGAVGGLGVGAGAGGLMASLSAALGPILAVLAAILGILAIIGTFIKSSLMAQKIFGNIMKSIQSILRPIGDIIGMIFMPLMFFLRVMGKFITAMWRPYRRDIMEALRLQSQYMNEFIKTGDSEAYGGAIEAGGLAMGFMIKPFFDLFVNSAAEAMKFVSDIVLEGIRFVGHIIIDAFISALSLLQPLIVGIVGAIFGEDIAKIVDDAIDTLKGKKTEIHTAFDELIDGIKTSLTEKIDTWKEEVKTSFGNALDGWKSVLTDRLDEMKSPAELAFSSLVRTAERTQWSISWALQDLETDITTFVTELTGLGTAIDTLGVQVNTLKTWVEAFGIVLERAGQRIADVLDRFLNFKLEFPDIFGDGGGGGGGGGEAGDFIFSQGKMHKFSNQDTVVGTKTGMGTNVNININLDTRELADLVERTVVDYVERKLVERVGGY